MIKPRDILNFLEKICMWGSTISLFSIAFLTTFEVLSRKFFDYSIPSLFEFTADYLMVALVFLPLSYVYVKGGHICVTLLLGYVPKAIRPVLDKLLGLSALVLFGLITVLGWNNAVRAFQFNEVSSGILAYPLAPAYLLIPIGAGMLSLRIIQSIIFPQGMKIHEKTSTEEVYIDKKISASN